MRPTSWGVLRASGRAQLAVDAPKLVHSLTLLEHRTVQASARELQGDRTDAATRRHSVGPPALEEFAALCSVRIGGLRSSADLPAQKTMQGRRHIFNTAFRLAGLDIHRRRRPAASPPGALHRGKDSGPCSHPRDDAVLAQPPRTWLIRRGRARLATKHSASSHGTPPYCSDTHQGSVGARRRILAGHRVRRRRRTEPILISAVTPRSNGYYTRVSPISPLAGRCSQGIGLRPRSASPQFGELDWRRPPSGVHVAAGGEQLHAARQMCLPLRASAFPRRGDEDKGLGLAHLTLACAELPSLFLRSEWGSLGDHRRKATVQADDPRADAARRACSWPARPRDGRRLCGAPGSTRDGSVPPSGQLVGSRYGRRRPRGTAR